MLHIAFLSPHSDPEAFLGEQDSGGQCVYEYQLAQALSALPDFKVSIFCRQNYHREAKSYINQSCKIIRVECGPKKFIAKEEIEQYLPEFCEKVNEILTPKQSSNETVILHGHYWDGGYSCLYMKTLQNNKIPMVWTPHSLGSVKRRRFIGENEEWDLNFIPRQAWESYSTILSDKIIVSSEDERQVLLKDYAIRESKIKIINPGVDFEVLFLPATKGLYKKFGLPSRGKILLCLGRMVRTKGYEFAIYALSELKKIYHTRASLVIVGGSPQKDDSVSVEEKNYLEFLRSEVKRLQLESDVYFLPALDHKHINEIFSIADVFLMPSKNEPFGLVIVEAMAMKVPVIAANRGGPVNLIKHNRTGNLVDIEDSAMVASYLKALFKDKYFSKKIAQDAYKYVQREFHWHQKAEQFAQVYREVSLQQPEEPMQDWVKNKYFLQQHFLRKN